MDTTTTRSSDGLGSFARLPYDVRFLIYEIALSRVGALEIINFSSGTSPKAGTPSIPTASVLDRPQLMPAILQLNKHINEESMPFLYARNTFTFVGLEELRAFTDPNIPGRDLISRISLPKMAMSRPFNRWDSLHKILPFDLRQLTIEIDTYALFLPPICDGLCRGLEVYLKQVDSDPAARRVHFRDVVALRLPTIKHLGYLIFDTRVKLSTDSQKLLWRRLGESIRIGHAATERCFKDLIEDSLVGVGVFGDVLGGA
ncbi:hypothetical protein Q7P35_001910 [Cladosporium inversicolor]